MTRLLRRSLFAGTTSAAMLAFGTLGAAPALAHNDHDHDHDPVVLSVGHVDALDVHLHGDHFDLLIKDDTDPPPVERDPADVILQALPESQTAVPNDARYAFLGDPGDPIWVLPQSQDPDLLWPGWSTEQLSSGTLEGNQVTLTLLAADGPDFVSIFNVNAFGDPVVRWHADAAGSVDPDTLDVPINTHAHANWAFGAEGEYTLTFQADAVLSDTGEPVTSGPVDYTFVVGDLPDHGNGDVELTIEGMAHHYHPGDTVELTAVQNPETGEDHYHWYSLCPGGDEFAVIPGEGSATYSFTATLALDGCQYLARLFDHNHDVIAESAPVTLDVDDHGNGEPDLSQQIIATIDEAAGGLVVSVDPDDRTVHLTTAELSDSGNRWVSTGELRPVTVTDTRTAAPGWNVTGQSGDFTGDSGEFEGRYLGWEPTVQSQATGQQVQPGSPVAPGFESGDGLGASQVLGSAASGAGLGTAELSADLTLELPTETPAGVYLATVTLTAI